MNFTTACAARGSVRSKEQTGVGPALQDSRRLPRRYQRRLSDSYLRFHFLQSLACGSKLRLEITNGGCLCAEDSLLMLKLPLLFLDRVHHRPDDGIVVHQQVAFAVFRDCFGDNSLHFLRDHSDMFFHIANAHRIVCFVAIANRVNLQNLAQAGTEAAVKVLEAAIGIRAPGASSGFIGAAIDGEEIVWRYGSDSHHSSGKNGHVVQYAVVE